MPNLKFWLAGSVALAVAGCTVGPDFVAPLPEMVNSKTFLDTGSPKPVRTPLPVLQNTVPAEPDVEWWRAFRDPILTRLEARVADQNLDVKTATIRIAESRAQLGTAAAAALPTVNGTGYVYREQYSQNGLISLVTLIIYSAQPLSTSHAVGGALLALCGGLLQTLLALIFWPLRRHAPERRILSQFYLELAAMSSSPLHSASAPPMSGFSIEAQQSLSMLGLDHSVESDRYRSLLNQADDHGTTGRFRNGVDATSECG